MRKHQATGLVVCKMQKKQSSSKESDGGEKQRTPKTLIKHRKLKAKTGGPVLDWSQGFNVYLLKICG
jgi:hypothetical protein